MRKRWSQVVIALVMVIVIIIVGSKVWNKQSTPAFNDDFTKEFLVKDAETPEGFHLFESGTKKYTMFFPENYLVADGAYYKKKGIGSESPDTENVFMHQEGITPKENQMIKGINLFLKPDGNVIIDSRLSGIIRKVNAPDDTEIQEVKDENKTIYYVENIDDYITENNDTNRYFYFYGFIVDNSSEQALFFELEETCFHIDEKECEIDFEKEKKMGLKMMKSVEFK